MVLPPLFLFFFKFRKPFFLPQPHPFSFISIYFFCLSIIFFYIYIIPLYSFPIDYSTYSPLPSSLLSSLFSLLSSLFSSPLLSPHPLTIIIDHTYDIMSCHCVMICIAFLQGRYDTTRIIYM